jgi:hypothetical protein
MMICNITSKSGICTKFFPNIFGHGILSSKQNHILVGHIFSVKKHSRHIDCD